jgi:hypothetical protein
MKRTLIIATILLAVYLLAINQEQGKEQGSQKITTQASVNTVIATLPVKQTDKSKLNQKICLTSKRLSVQKTAATVKTEETKPVSKADSLNIGFKNWLIVTSTAYNAGDTAQCDKDPCKAADGSDICERLANGEKLAAANFVKFGSQIEVKNDNGKIVGIYTVVDRTKSDYKYRFDIAFQKHEKKLARKFGNQKLYIRVIYEPAKNICYHNTK